MSRQMFCTLSYVVKIPNNYNGMPNSIVRVVTGSLAALIHTCSGECLPIHASHAAANFT